MEGGNIAMSTILNEIVTLLVGGIVAVAQGIGSAASSAVSAFFIDNTGSNPALSVYGGMVIIFAAVALSIGFTTRIFTWLTSLGN